MGDNIRCTHCGYTGYTKAGLQWRDGKKNIQRRRCLRCGRIYILPNGHPYAEAREKEKVDASS